MPVPNTKTASILAVTIEKDGIVLGNITSWNPSQTRNHQRIYEINADTEGETVEIVPGAINADTIQISRAELYSQRFLEAFGAIDPSSLKNQTDAFNIWETYRLPVSGSKIGYKYIGCWFTAMNWTYDVSNTSLITIAGTIEVTKRRKYIG